MNTARNDAGAPLWGATGDGARAALAALRDQLSAYASLPPDPDDAEAPGRTKTAADTDRTAKAPSRERLPADIAHLLAEYERDHPGERVEPVRLLTLSGTTLSEHAPFTGADIPADDSLLVLAVTETVADSERIEAHSKVLIARHLPAE